jgi:hypothetical protein
MATHQSDNYKQLQNITGGIAVVAKTNSSYRDTALPLPYPAGQLVMGFQEAFHVDVFSYVKRH